MNSRHLEEYLGGRAPRSRPWTPGPRYVGGGSQRAWLTGSGTPLVTPGRSGPSVTLQCGDDVLLVDCGNGVAYELAKLGIELFQVSMVLVTHHHIDHNSDLALLMTSPWALEKRVRPLRVVGPRGTREHVDRLLSAHHFDLLVRQQHGFDPTDAAPEVLEVDDGDHLEGPQWRVRAFEVDHRPVWPALGYRFDLDGCALVVSGDTRPSDNLVKHAADCDVLVHEALWPGYGFPDYHTSPRDLGRIATECRARRLVVTHMIPGHLPDEVWVDEIALHYDGPVTVGRDRLPLVP